MILIPISGSFFIVIVGNSSLPSLRLNRSAIPDDCAIDSTALVFCLLSGWFSELGEVVYL